MDQVSYVYNFLEVDSVKRSVVYNAKVNSDVIKDYFWIST